MRVTAREYSKLVQISMIADQMKINKEFRKSMRTVMKDTQDNLPEDAAPMPSVDTLINMFSRLPFFETNISKPSTKRKTPKTMYFTDPQPTTQAVKNLYRVVKDDVTVRHNQMKHTCPTDVRVMFYAYIRGNNLVEESDIIIDKFLTKLAPKTLKNKARIQRKDSSTIWKICTEIRGQ